MAARDFAPELDPTLYPDQAIPDRTYEAVVFKRLPASEDFAQSETIMLPGRYTAEGAWAAVHAALRAGSEMVGGEIREAARGIEMRKNAISARAV